LTTEWTFAHSLLYFYERTKERIKYINNHLNNRIHATGSHVYHQTQHASFNMREAGKIY